MRKTSESPGEKIVKDIKRATRKQYSAEEKIRIVLMMTPRTHRRDQRNEKGHWMQMLGQVIRRTVVLGVMISLAACVRTDEGVVLEALRVPLATHGAEVQRIGDADLARTYRALAAV